MTVDLAWWRRVLVADRGDVSPERSAGSERYVLLPRPSDPRVVVDSSSNAAMSEALRRFGAVKGLPDRAVGIVGALAPAVSRLGPGWYVATFGDAPNLREHLCGVLDRDVRLSIAVGPPRPNRKPVVRCWDGDALVAVAKLGPDPHTAAMVRNEATWLQELAANPIDGVVVPEALHHGAFGASELLVMSVLPIDDDSGVEFAAVPNQRLEQFIRSHEAESPGLGDSPWWAELQRRVDGLDVRIDRAVERVGSDPHADDVVCAAWHGDWSPWNVGRSRTGAWCIWDWERTRTGVPLGMDQLHLHHQYGDGLENARPALAELGVPDAHFSLIRQLYLLELAARHNEAHALESDRHATVLHLLGSGDDVMRGTRGAA